MSVLDHPDCRVISAQAQEIDSLRSTVEALDRKIRGLKLALRGMVDSHLETCNDGGGSVCSACAVALSELRPKETP